MPPKRPLRKPQGPTGPPTRTALHTQELMLFSSPIAAAPAKRTASTNRRASGSKAGPALGGASNTSAAASGTSKTRSSSQRHRAPAPSTASAAGASHITPISSTSATTSRTPGRPAPDYEPLPERFSHAVPCAPSSYSSEITPASLSHPQPQHSTAGRVPSPPPSRNGGAGIVASGSSSRVVRLLRDARAAVQDPIRPETPLDTFRGGPTAAGGAGVGSSAAHLPRQPPHSVESRLRRRLPAGGRLAPMSASGSADEPNTALSSSTSPLLHGTSSPPPPSSSSSSPLPPAALPLPAAGLSSEIDIRAHAHGQGAINTKTAQHESAFDSDSFATLFAAAQQRGEEGLVDCMHLLARLREWLANSSAGAAHFLSPAATGCLQATLLHFCQHWPTGDALRHAVENFAALNGSTELNSSVNGGDQASVSMTTSSVPLSYAEVALLAAGTMLRAYAAMPLIEEPISFAALVNTVHTIAQCGLADWVALEPSVLEVLVNVLQILATPVTDSSNRTTLQAAALSSHERWTVQILEILACCCEEAAQASASAAATAAVDAESKGGVWAAAAASAAGHHAGTSREEQDMIRGRGLADDASDAAIAHGQQRAASASIMSSSTSLHRLPQTQASRTYSHSPISSSTTLPQGSPINVLRHGSGGGDGASLRHTGSAGARNALKNLTTRLLSLGLLKSLQELSVHALQQLQMHAASATTAMPHALSLPPSSMPFAVLPVVGTLYRLLAQFHAASLQASGVLPTLVSMVHYGAADTATVESAARALVKLTYDDDCLRELQAGGTALLDAVGHALLTQVRLHTDRTTDASIELLVSRLCGVVARVSEDNATLQAYLATPAMTHVLEVLAQRYLATAVDLAQGSAPTAAVLAPAPVLQSLVWVLGIAAMAPTCSLHLVECVTPLLVGLLQRVRASSAMTTTAVYILMCLSNLSYFFNRFEQAADEVHVEWLSAVCASLCFTLAEYLFEDNVEATVEATRILGNISYTNTGRDWMETNKCDEVVVIFLGHEDLRVVYNCCGILLNLTAASPCRVVEEPELLRMLLSYTSRYTQDDTIGAAASLERERLMKQRLLDGGSRRGQAEQEEEEQCAAEASSSAAQIADLVEKLLMNVHGLLTLTSSVAADSDDI